MPKGDKQTQRKTIEYIKERVSEIEPTTELLPVEYKNNRMPLEFRCECGKIFSKSWSTIVQNKTCKCRSCARKDGWKYNRGRENFNEDACREFISYGFYPQEDIGTSKRKVLCKDENGYLGYISLENVRRNKHFSIFSTVFNEKNLLYNLNQYAENNGYNTKVIAYYGGSKSTEILIDCVCECGEEFRTCVGNFTTQNKVRCGKCSKSQSNIEHLVEIELKSLGIKFEKQKRFDECRNPITNYPLPFDFYIQDKNMCIEVDGEQHYKASKFYSSETNEEANVELNNRKYKDCLKDKFCVNNGITLVRIPYKAFTRYKNNYKEIIQQLFKRS